VDPVTTELDTPDLTGVSVETAKALLNAGASFAILQIAASILEDGLLDEDDVAALGWLDQIDPGMRMHAHARMLDATEAIREAVREVDGLLLVLTGS
jgi:hypothetical protein